MVFHKINKKWMTSRRVNELPWHSPDFDLHTRQHNPAGLGTIWIPSALRHPLFTALHSSMHVVQTTENFALARTPTPPQKFMHEPLSVRYWLLLGIMIALVKFLSMLQPSSCFVSQSNPHTTCKWISTTFCILLSVFSLLFTSYFRRASIGLFSFLPPLYCCHDLKLALAAINMRDVAHPRLWVALGCFWTFGSLCAGLWVG